MAVRLVDSRLAEAEKMPAPLPLSPLAPLLEFVAGLLCSVELDFLNLVIYWQSGTAIAAESHFPIHVDFKPSAAAWAGKVDNLHENPFRITSPETKIK